MVHVNPKMIPTRCNVLARRLFELDNKVFSANVAHTRTHSDTSDLKAAIQTTHAAMQ